MCFFAIIYKYIFILMLFILTIMKRTTISILMLVAGLALVAALAMPAYASSSYCYGNRPSLSSWHANCPVVTSTPDPTPLALSRYHQGNDDSVDGAIHTATPTVKEAFYNGNANCKANICNSGNKKACVKPVITLVGNKCPKKVPGLG